MKSYLESQITWNLQRSKYLESCMLFYFVTDPLTIGSNFSCLSNTVTIENSYITATVTVFTLDKIIVVKSSNTVRPYMLIGNKTIS